MFLIEIDLIINFKGALAKRSPAPIKYLYGLQITYYLLGLIPGLRQSNGLLFY